MERTEKDDAQKAKLVFFSLAALVVILLIWSVAATSKAKSELKAAKQELEKVEAVKADNAKLEQMVRDLNQENDTLKKQVKQLEAKAKAKPAAKKKAPAKSTKKTSKKGAKYSNL